MVRSSSDKLNLIKQYMDGGARSLMIPNVRSAAQASEIAGATHYAPMGVRGFASAQRANRFGRIKNYHTTEQDHQLLALQIECAAGVAEAAEIAAVDGADVLVIGPGDLSTNLKAMGKPTAEPVQAAFRKVIDARRYVKWGCRMLAVGTDLGLRIKAADRSVANFKDQQG